MALVSKFPVEINNHSPSMYLKFSQKTNIQYLNPEKFILVHQTHFGCLEKVKMVIKNCSKQMVTVLQSCRYKSYAIVNIKYIIIIIYIF